MDVKFYKLSILINILIHDMEANSVWLNEKNECDMSIYWTIVLIAKYIWPAALTSRTHTALREHSSEGRSVRTLGCVWSDLRKTLHRLV